MSFYRSALTRTFTCNVEMTLLQVPPALRPLRNCFLLSLDGSLQSLRLYFMYGSAAVYEVRYLRVACDSPSSWQRVATVTIALKTLPRAADVSSCTFSLSSISLDMLLMALELVVLVAEKLQNLGRSSFSYHKGMLRVL